MHEHKPFYGTEVQRAKEAEMVQGILKKYAKQAVTEQLQEQIYADLAKLKYEELLTMPFAVNLIKDPLGKSPDYIDIVLETKV